MDLMHKNTIYAAYYTRHIVFLILVIYVFLSGISDIDILNVAIHSRLTGLSVVTRGALRIVKISQE